MGTSPASPAHNSQLLSGSSGLRYFRFPLLVNLLSPCCPAPPTGSIPLLFICDVAKTFLGARYPTGSHLSQAKRIEAPLNPDEPACFLSVVTLWI